MADNTRIEIFEIEIKNLQSIDELNKQLAEAKKSYKAAQVGTEEYIKAQNEIVSINTKLGEHKNKLKEVENQSKLNDNTIEGLRAKYKSLTAEIVKTDLGNGKLSKSYTDLKTQAKAVSDRLKGLEDGFGNNTRNVGNYTASIKEAIAGTGSFGSGIVNLGTVIATNPIGLLVTALTGLVALFNQNDDAATFFAGVMKGVGVAVSLASSAVVEFSKYIGELASLLFDKVSPILKTIASPFVALFNVIRENVPIVDTIATKFEDMAKSVADATAAGIAYEKAMDDLEQKQNESLVTLAKLNQTIAINEKALKNSTLSYEQQLNILDKIQKTDEQRAKQKLSLIDDELKAERALLESQGEGSKAREETYFKILQLEAQRIDAQTESLALQEKYDARRDQFAAAESKRISGLLEKDQEYLAFKRLATDEQLEMSDEVVAKTRDNSEEEVEINREARDFMTEDSKANDEKEADSKKKAEDEKQKYIQGTFAVASGIASLGKQLSKDNFEVQKAFSVTEAIINTAKGVTSALGSAPPPVNFVLAGITAAAGAAQVATIAQSEPSAAAGGGDFVTTKPTLLLVGDNPGGRERVSVTPLSGRGQTRVAKNSGLIAMAGGGSLTVDTSGMSQVGNSIGGDVLAQNNISKTMAETMARIGNPVVSVVDIKKVTKKTDVTESRAKLKV
jgi:hypothetical protein